MRARNGSTSERAGGPAPGARHSRFERAVARVTLLCFLASFAAGPAAGEPTETALGPAETTVGQGHFSANTPTLTEYTQESARAVVDWGLDWQQPADHALAFRQQQGFAVLNRSPGVHAANFRGSVSCDATCIFANEAGITFHDGSTVDVGQLIVAAGRLSDGDFLSGDYLFRDLLGQVVNHGTLRGDSIALLGERVANFGRIETPQGSFAMVAGRTIRLREHESPIVIESPLLPGSSDAGSPFGDLPAVENAGTIEASGGEVRLAAGDLLSFAIRQTGEIRARKISLEGGDSALVKVGGTLDARGLAPGETGGEIDVLGGYLAIGGDAVLDASGHSGGGRIRVGGDRRGAGDTPTAQAVHVHPDAQLRADATANGDGGELIVYAEDSAQVYGRLSARGGEQGGDGGFVETSGRRFLDVRRAPEVHARSGLAGDRGGEWLIDPNNITIVASLCGIPPQCLDEGLSDEILEDPEFESGVVLQPTVDDTQISAGVIANALSRGTNVTILTETISDTQGAQVGNLTVDAAIVVQEDQAPGPNTAVTLTLGASQHLSLNQDIRVQRRAGSPADRASDLSLDLVLVAGDSATLSQAPAPPEQVPNAYLGKLTVDADLASEGGDIVMQGLGVELAAGRTIATNGGALDILSRGAGDIVIAGDVDTSTAVVNDAVAAPSGGSFTMRAVASRVPASGEPGAPTSVVGGEIDVLGDVTTGGGRVDWTAQGGADPGEGLRIAGTVSTGGGAMTLRAVEVTQAPLSAPDTEVIGGGTITLEAGAVLESGGGDVDIGVTDPVTGIVGARDLVILGTIDTRALDDNGTPDDTRVGGLVFLNSSGDDASTQIGAPGGATLIRTNGSEVQSVGDGSFALVDAVIDASASPGLAADQPVSSRIFVDHTGDVTVTTTAAGATQLLADESATLRAGTSFAETKGDGDLVFSEQNGATALISAPAITLSARDDDDADGESAAVVTLANTEFAFPGAADPELTRFFWLQQDSDLATDSVVANLQPHFGTLPLIVLKSLDGAIALNEETLFEVPGLELDLEAKTTFTVANGVAPAGGAVLDSLALATAGDLTVDAALAAFLSGAAQDGVAKALTLSTGVTGEADAANLLIAGSTNPLAPLQLVAGESLVLQAGRGSVGDLSFADHTLLRAPEIELRAGNGDQAGSSRVQTETMTNVRFDDGAGGPLDAFTLRQDAALDGDDVLPAASFAGGLDGVRYTLRADAVGSGIALDGSAAAQLADTDLRLFANGPIDLSALAAQQLVVERLELGGIGSFEYNSSHNDKFSFSAGVPSRELVIRAGIGGTGVLSFGAGLTVTADDIRLIAGDGVGGGAVGSLAGSSIVLTPFFGGAAPIFRKDANNGPDRFLFQQDNALGEEALPRLATHFAGHAPRELAVRVDDQELRFDGFSSGTLLDAAERVILSAPLLTFERRDGSDLDLAALFGDGSGGAAPAVELRTESLVLAALDPAGATGALPEIRTAGPFRISSFDGLPAGAATTSPPAPFDFDAVIDTAPAEIVISQDADIGPANLLSTAQLGTNGGASFELYRLGSNFGSIRVTPADVVGADLQLVLAGLDDEVQSLGPRTIAFDDPGQLGFSLESLQVQNPFDWRIDNAADPQLDLLIAATDFIELLAALSNEGDLSFGDGVTLRSRAIVLQAGEDPAQPLRGVPLPDEDDPLPVVDTTGLSLVFEDQSGTAAGTVLRIFQHGKFVDAGTPGADESRIVAPGQISVIDTGAGTLLDELQYSSISSDIEIADFGAGTQNFPAQRLTLVAGSGLQRGGLIRIARAAGLDLNLSVDAAGVEVFEALNLFGERIELATSGAGVIRARGNNLLLLGPQVGGTVESPIVTPPESLRFTQSGSFVEAADVTDCSGGCLPEAFQLGPSFAAGIDYTIESLAGQIVVNEALAQKVWGSDLELLAADANPSAPDVVFDLASQRPLDLFVSSLSVGDGTTRTWLSAAAGDADQDLTIVAGGTLAFAGPVEVDGAVEIVGDQVEFTDTVDERIGASGSSDLTVGVVSEGRFAGDVGGTTALDRLRVNFDPGTSGRVRFGSANGGEDTLVRASQIEFFAVSDAANDIQAARSPLDATIYKRNGDLRFVADSFAMGVGEKLAVQGDLAIEVTSSATLGDLAALDIRVGDPGGGAPLIALQRRAPGAYRDISGAVRPDGGLDLVGNSIDLDGQIVLTGTGQNPIFGLADPRTAPAFMQGFSILAARGSRLPLQASDFEGPGGLFLDLHPEGASRDDPSSIFFADDLVPQPAPFRTDAWLPWRRAALSDLFVFARPLDPREQASWLGGATLIDDVGRDLGAWDAHPLPIAARRLDGAEAERAVLLFEQIFGADGGQVAARRQVLQNAVDQYVRNTGARRVVGFELRRYVKNRPSSLYQAYRLLEDLDLLFRHHRGLGLVPGEYRPIQARWLAAIRPEGITTEELAEAVQPSRYVRGTDVLDIFGD